MDGEQIVVNFPNEGAYTLSENVIKKWKIIDANIVEYVVFCKTKDGSSFSMLLDDYKRIFNK